MSECRNRGDAAATNAVHHWDDMAVISNVIAGPNDNTQERNGRCSSASKIVHILLETKLTSKDIKLNVWYSGTSLERPPFEKLHLLSNEPLTFSDLNENNCVSPPIPQH